MPDDPKNPPTSFSDASSREALRKMILDGVLGAFDEKNAAANEPLPHILWRLLDQIETSERLTAIVREDARATLAAVELQRDRAEQMLRDEMKLAHDLANRFSHAASALELIAKDLSIEHKEPPTSGWANPIWEGVRARKGALADAETRATAAETLLQRIAKYAREDRADTPGVTRLARALDGVDQLLASPSPPAPEVGEDKPQRVDLSVVVMGEPSSVNVATSQTMRSVRDTALVATRHIGRPAKDFDVRSADGRLVDLDHSAVWYFGTTIYIQPSAGGGGSAPVAPPAAGVVDLMRVLGLPESTPVHTSGTAPPAAGKAGRACYTCGKSNCSPQNHAGWNPNDEGHG